MCWAVPPLLTHGSLVEADSDRMLLGQEHCVVQGEAIPEAPVKGERFRSCLGPLLSTAAKTMNGQLQLKKLDGNTMNLVNLFTFQSYCLASLEVFLLIRC